MKYVEHKEDTGGIAARNYKGPLWYFLPENDGSFLAPYAEYISRLYLPLMNRKGLKSYVTPELKGDIASSFQSYLTAATVTEELHRNVSNRNFWIKLKGHQPWSPAGNSAWQRSNKWTGQRDESEIEGKLGAFISRRRNKGLGIESEIIVFVPDTDDFVELMKVTIKNISGKALSFIPYSATPIFARHADNFRDHRQVTTMFQKVFIEKNGVRVKPSIVHDESGHSVNKINYAVLGFEADAKSPQEIWPLMNDFIGEGGSLDNPEAVVNELKAPSYAPDEVHGKEAVGAMRYAAKNLHPGEEASFIIVHGITENEKDVQKWKDKYGSAELFERYYREALNYWQGITSALSVKTARPDFDNWVKWVNFQLKCRQIFGNSFLPDFGYGRGGRGWRDLWQDLLSIFLVDPESAKEEILNSLKGVRIDGSNATIIGSEPGTFVADRNNIPRNWCDHGAWPAFVVDFYLQQSGDMDILFREIPYWKDHLIFRTRQKDEKYEREQGPWQKDKHSNEYNGSIFEHLLIQQLSAFYHVGEHNILLLEGGDWNDTYDMARERGESTGFYAFYGRNFKLLAGWLEMMQKHGIETIAILEEIQLLLNQHQELNSLSPKEKQHILKEYFSRVSHAVSGKKVQLRTDDLRRDLLKMADHITSVVREPEWLDMGDHGFFNGHYDNNGNPVDGQKDDGVKMDLTTQVMSTMHDLATDDQIERMLKSANLYLRDGKGLRLCTPFKEIDMKIGRLTGFTYGNKEHGSKWMQQNIMLAYGLLRRGFREDATRIIMDAYDLSTDSATSKIFPGLPSYFGPGDRGAYAYLTGSSTWFTLTLTTQLFGVRGVMGNLCLQPNLSPLFFDEEGSASILCRFRGIAIKVVYYFPDKEILDKYRPAEITINNRVPEILSQDESMIVISKEELDKLDNHDFNLIKISLKNG